MAKKHKTLGKLKQEAQKAFNKYIRLRDSGAGFFTCISCGMTKSTDEMDAGHFYPVQGYDGLRFNEDNVDLNRNFADHTKPYPPNHGYNELANVISPNSIFFWSNIKTGFRLFWYRLKNKKNKLKVAITGT